MELFGVCVCVCLTFIMLLVGFLVSLEINYTFLIMKLNLGKFW